MTTALTAPLISWYEEHARELPWRHPEFGAWGILVSEFMLQQTQVSRVIPMLAAWLERWPTPAALAADEPAEAVRMWGTLGYPRRALWLHRAATQLAQQHGNTVPDDLDALLALTGVGDYTARAVAVFAFGSRHPVVDTNTRRVLARAVDGRSQPGAPAKRDLDAMLAILPVDAAAAATVNAATMELGATVCVARRPRCTACPIADACAWHLAGHPDTGDAPRRQAAYAGSDRQARGVVLRALRESPSLAVPPERLTPLWPDAGQLGRAVDSLVRDGLAELSDGVLRLPS